MGVGKSIRYTLSLTNDAATIGWDVTDVDKWADEDNQEKILWLLQCNN